MCIKNTNQAIFSSLGLWVLLYLLYAFVFNFFYSSCMFLIKKKHSKKLPLKIWYFLSVCFIKRTVMNSCQFYSFRTSRELVPYFPFLLLWFRPEPFFHELTLMGFFKPGLPRFSWITFIINKCPHKQPFEWYGLPCPSSKGPGHALRLTLEWVSIKMQQRIPCNTEGAVSPRGGERERAIKIAQSGPFS